MDKTYRCLTCGFAMTIDASSSFQEENFRHHGAELSHIGKATDACPACHQYLKKFGGRQAGKNDMPDITSPGILEDGDDPVVKQKHLEIERDFQDIVLRRASGKLNEMKKKWKGKNLFGFSVDDLVSQHDRINAIKSDV